MKDGLIFYITQYEAVKELTDEQLGRLFRAIFEKQLGNNITLDDDIKIAFNFIFNKIQEDRKKYEDTCKARAEAGSKGGKQKVANQAKGSKAKQKVAKLANNNSNSNSNCNSNNNCNENVKENNKKKIHFADFVSMTNAEYDKLVDTHGKDFADQCITVLDNYKGSTGKKYKDDYRAILSWVIDKVEKEKPKQLQTSNPFLKYMLDEGGDT